MTNKSKHSRKRYTTAFGYVYFAFQEWQDGFTLALSCVIVFVYPFSRGSCIPASCRGLLHSVITSICWPRELSYLTRYHTLIDGDRCDRTKLPKASSINRQYWDQVTRGKPVWRLEMSIVWKTNSSKHKGLLNEQHNILYGRSWRFNWTILW